MPRLVDARRVQDRAQQIAVVQANREVGEAEREQRLARGRADLGLDHRRRRAEDVHVALVELAEAAARRPVGAPHRLDLVALEEARQVAVLGDDARERHRQVVAQRQVGELALLVGALGRPVEGTLQLRAALEDAEDQLVALLAVLAEERLEVLDCRGLERLEAEALVDRGNRLDHEAPAADVAGQEVAHPARGLGGGFRHQSVDPGPTTRRSGLSRVHANPR